jgi:hypothetical protein
MEGVNRFLGGATASFAVQRSLGEWGVGVNASLQGAYGRSEINGDTGVDSDWTIARLKLGLRLITPVGPCNVIAEEGQLNGDYGILDAFSLGGQSAGLVPSSLDMNRLDQPALPAYHQVGDRMRRLRAEYGSLTPIYYEQVAVWHSKGGRVEYQRVAGFEVRLHEAVDEFLLRLLLGTVPQMTIGVHRTLDGVMKNKTVFTANISIAL